MAFWRTKAYGQGVCRYILSVRVVISGAWQWEEKLRGCTELLLNSRATTQWFTVGAQSRPAPWPCLRWWLSATSNFPETAHQSVPAVKNGVIFSPSSGPCWQFSQTSHLCYGFSTIGQDAGHRGSPLFKSVKTEALRAPRFPINARPRWGGTSLSQDSQRCQLRSIYRQMMHFFLPGGFSQL